MTAQLVERRCLEHLIYRKEVSPVEILFAS